jgi:hypothetical protein
MISSDLTFPSYSTPVDISVFPGAYHLDLDNDGIRDLVASPNYTVESNNYNGNWYYKNTGADDTPVFILIQRGLFQKEMIEHGEASVPVFFDHNGDGLKDLVIGNFGIWDVDHFPYNRYVSQLRLYLNTGTSTTPVYTLADTNYQNVFAVHDTTALLPTFGDLDGDGDEDMIIGDIAGRIHRYQNTAGAGNPAIMSIQQMNITDDLGSIIDVGTNAAPHLVDIDRDGDLDLLIGRNNGRIVYYQNIGTAVSPVFKMQTVNFGGVNVCEPFSSIGYSVPYVYDYMGEYHLFVGSLQGKIFHYDSLENNLTGNFNLLDSLPVSGEYNYGITSAPAVADINNDSLPDMLIGNFRGGLVMYTATGVDTTTSTGNEIIGALNEQVFIYPNPAQNSVWIKTNLQGKKNLIVYSVDGRKIMETDFISNLTEISITALPAGVYVFRVNTVKTLGTVHNVRVIKQ